MSMLIHAEHAKRPCRAESVITAAPRHQRGHPWKPSRPEHLYPRLRHESRLRPQHPVPVAAGGRRIAAGGPGPVHERARESPTRCLGGGPGADTEHKPSRPGRRPHLGELVVRGNTVMKLTCTTRRPPAPRWPTAGCTPGDLVMLYPDGHGKIKDRAKDIIVSGENISSLEIGKCHQHTRVGREAAVAARPDSRWGEATRSSPCGRSIYRTTGDDLVRWCPRAPGAPSKAPRHVTLTERPDRHRQDPEFCLSREWAGRRRRPATPAAVISCRTAHSITITRLPGGVPCRVPLYARMPVPGSSNTGGAQNLSPP